MKRLILALGIGAAALAVSTPASAQTGCRWYDVNCRIATGDTRAGTSVGTSADRVDSSWRIVGHDANGNAIYERRRVDGNGNVVVERARRDALGRMVIIDRDINNRNNRNDRNVRDSRRYDANGMECKYKENERGYKEHCKYVKNKSNRLQRIDGVNRTNRVNSERYRRANADNVYRTSAVSGDKYKAGKANSAKHNKSNGKAKGHNKH